MSRTIALAAILSAFAVPSLAQAPWTATLQTAATKASFIGHSVLWACTDTGCVSRSDTPTDDEMGACKGVAKQVGPLTAFVAGHGAFNAARLARCNEDSPKLSTTTTASR
jgi:hypothetical protein